MLTDPRARRQFRSRLCDLRNKPAFYGLRDEPHATILVACSKCDWKVAYDRAALIVSHGPDHLLTDLLGELASSTCSKVGHHLDRCGAYFVEADQRNRSTRSRGWGAVISEGLSDESTAINFRRRRCATENGRARTPRTRFVLSRRGKESSKETGLRGIEWVIFEVKVREKRGLRRGSAFRGMGYLA